MDVARLSFAAVDEQIEFVAQVHDGERVAAGTVLAIVSGNARHLLTAERTALNFLTHLSGIATATQQIVDSVADIITNLILPALYMWADSAEDEAIRQRRHKRIELCWGVSQTRESYENGANASEVDTTDWVAEHVLLR